MLKRSTRWVLRVTLFVITSFFLVGSTLLIGHAVMVRNGPDLQWWHTQEISSEFSAADQSDIKTLEQYLANEEKVFQELAALEQEHAGDNSHQFLNRFRRGNAAYPVKQGQNFNRSYELRPDNIKGGVLLLHGLTDSPYSLRHMGEMFVRRGFYVLSLRMPGHGTIPAELDRMEWEDWQAAAELGARHVAGVLDSQQPFYVVGYSNGASLALNYTLDAIAAKDKRVPDHVFLLSPMIAVDTLAKYSPVFLWLGDVSFFSKSRWMDIRPEYDPHKYNSFPVNAALQSYKISKNVAGQIDSMYAKDQLQQMPPVLAFQSLVDTTVVPSAAFDELFQKLPDNGSELVIFDVNRAGALEEFIQPRHAALLNRMTQQANGRFTLSIVSNKDATLWDVSETRYSHSHTGVVTRRLPYQWPKSVYSLTHVAIPFPLNDAVYGLEPDEPNLDFPHLGDIQLLGESGTLVLPSALLQRLRSNPFYGYVQTKIEDVISAEQNFPGSLNADKLF